MKFKFIGRPTSFQGKRLFDILFRLNNFGIGRLVYRYSLSEFPEPSYFRITRIEPCPERNRYIPLTCQKNDGDSRHVAYGIEVHRGKNYGEVVMIHSFYPDWRLVPKHEEEKFLLNNKQLPASSELDVKERFPPLIDYMINKDKGLNADQSIMLTLLKPKGYEPVTELR